MSLKELPNSEISNHHKILTSLAAGAIAGALAKTVIAPLDRTKISFQTSNQRYTFRAAFNFLVNTVRKYGVRTLWRGNSATMVRVIPYAAIQFSAHEQWKHVLGVEKDGRLNPKRRFAAGSLAGVTASSLTYPLDLARARLAVSEKAQYKTLRSVFYKIWRVNGFFALYRGILPTLMGVIPYAGTSFFTYETLKRQVYHYHEVRGESTHLNPNERLLCGAFAGLVGQTASYPLDIVRRRMQTGVAPSTLGTWHILKGVFAHEGLIHGLYKGLSMNWIKGPIAVGISFTTFDTVVHLLRTALP